MKTALLFTLLAISTAIFADAQIKAGGFLSLQKNKKDELSSPSIGYLSGNLNYDLIKGLTLSGDSEILHGSPESDLSKSNMIYTNYSYVLSRFFLSYKIKNGTFGSATTLYFFAKDDKLSRPVSQMPLRRDIEAVPARGYRSNFMMEELFFSYNPLKNLKISASGGVNTQTLLTPFDDTVDDIKDSNIYAKGEISYRVIPLLEPFGGVYHYNDMNDSNLFNLTELRTGVRGDFLKDTDVHLFYNIHYKNISSKIINENNRMAASFKGRYSLPSNTDFFAWFYHEYSIGKDDKLRYVNRNVSFLARQWLIPRKINFGVGSTFMIERKNSDETLYFPMWPFAETNIYWKNFRAYAKIVLKKDKDFQEQKYKTMQTRVESAASYRVRYFTPSLGVYYNSYDDDFYIKSFGLNFSLSANF